MVIGLDGNEANVKDRVGSGVYAFELLKEFAKNKDHQFLVYLKEKSLPDLPKESASFKYTVFGPQKLWTQFALPLKLFFGEKPDVFFSMGHYGPRFSRVPYVITIHDLSYLHYPEMFKKNDLYQLVNWTRYSVKAAVHIIAVSETTKNDIIKNYNVDPSKITVTYEGYDKERFAPQSKVKVEKVKKKYKIEGEYIIFVGTLQPRKNLERLAEAFSMLTPGVRSGVHLDNTPGVLSDDLKLVICGKKGWLYNSIFEKVKNLKLGDKVILTDYVPDEDLSALMSGARVYALPSLWEGFGIPAIEAQACGIPVIVSNTSSLPEIVTPPTVIPAEPVLDPDRGAGIQNKNQILDHVFDRESQTESVENDDRTSAILVDPTNVDSISKGIKKALDPKTRTDLVKKGFQNIKRFSWQKCASQTLGVLEKVAMRTRPIV